MSIELMIFGFILFVLLAVSLSNAGFKPLRLIGNLALQFVIGAILLYFGNFFAEMAGISLPINPVTAGIVGFLRIPGLLALVGIKLFMF